MTEWQNIRTPFSFLDENQLSYIKMNLDIDSKWESLANSLGFEHNLIKWLRERSHSESPTQLMMKKIKEEKFCSVEDVMRGLEKTQNELLLKYFKENYSCVRNKYEHSERIKKIPPGTFPNRNPSNKNQRDIISSFSRLQTVEHKKCSREVHIFSTFTKMHLTRAVLVLKCLHSNGFMVSNQYNDSNLIQEHNLKWIYDRFRKAQSVLIFITPDYLQNVVGGEFSTINPNNPYLEPCHIYKKMQTEEMLRSEESDEKEKRRTTYNGADKEDNKQMKTNRNKKFIGVILTDTFESESSYLKGTLRKQLPNWIKPLYYWPDDFKNLLFYISDPQDEMTSYIMNRIMKNGQDMCVERSELASIKSKRHLQNDGKKNVKINVKNDVKNVVKNDGKSGSSKKKWRRLLIPFARKKNICDEIVHDKHVTPEAGVVRRSQHSGDNGGDNGGGDNGGGDNDCDDGCVVRNYDETIKCNKSKDNDSNYVSNEDYVVNNNNDNNINNNNNNNKLINDEMIESEGSRIRGNSCDERHVVSEKNNGDFKKEIVEVKSIEGLKKAKKAKQNVFGSSKRKVVDVVCCTADSSISNNMHPSNKRQSMYPHPQEQIRHVVSS